MAPEQKNITEAAAKLATEAARVVVQAMAVANADNSERTQNAGPKVGGPMMKQPTFHWSSTDQYPEIRN